MARNLQVVVCMTRSAWLPMAIMFSLATLGSVSAAPLSAKQVRTMRQDARRLHRNASRALRRAESGSAPRSYSFSGGFVSKRLADGGRVQTFRMSDGQIATLIFDRPANGGYYNWRAAGQVDVLDHVQSVPATRTLPSHGKDAGRQVGRSYENGRWIRTGVAEIESGRLRVYKPRAAN